MEGWIKLTLRSSSFPVHIKTNRIEAIIDMNNGTWSEVFTSENTFQVKEPVDSILALLSN